MGLELPPEGVQPELPGTVQHEFGVLSIAEQLERADIRQEMARHRKRLEAEWEAAWLRKKHAEEYKIKTRVSLAKRTPPLTVAQLIKFLRKFDLALPVYYFEDDYQYGEHNGSTLAELHYGDVRHEKAVRAGFSGGKIVIG